MKKRNSILDIINKRMILLTICIGFYIIVSMVKIYDLTVESQRLRQQLQYCNEDFRSFVDDMNNINDNIEKIKNNMEIINNNIEELSNQLPK